MVLHCISGTITETGRHYENKAALVKGVLISLKPFPEFLLLLTLH